MYYIKAMEFSEKFIGSRKYLPPQSLGPEVAPVNGPIFVCTFFKWHIPPIKVQYLHWSFCWHIFWQSSADADAVAAISNPK